MLTGLPGTNKGTTRDTKYTYIAAIDDEITTGNSNAEFKGLSIYVKETDTRLDRNKTTDVAAWEKHEINTPLRARIFGMQSYYHRVLKKVNVAKWDNDIDEFSGKNDLWVVEKIPEMWIDQNQHYEYQKLLEDNLANDIHYDNDFNYIVDSDSYGDDSNGLYIISKRNTLKGNRTDQLGGNPFNVSIQSFKDGSKRRVYLVYVMEHTLILPKAYFCYSINGKISDYFNKTPLYSENSYQKGRSRYKRDISAKYYVPVIMELRYEDQKMKFKAVASPVADTNNKIAASVGDYAHNFNLIPWKRYEKPLLGGSSTQCDGDLYLPSNNRCLTSSYLDYEEEHLMIITTYEGGKSDTSFPEHRLYVSRYDTTSEIDPLPDRMKYIDLLSVIKSGGGSHYGNDTNVSYIDITKWQDNYIISVSYDNGTATSLQTVLLKMPVGTSYNESDIEYYTKIKNSGFAGIQGLTEGWAT